MAACDGCLGDLKCWVCGGTGLIEVRQHGRFLTCHRCYGSGKCFLCQEIAIKDIEAPPIFRVNLRGS